MNRRAFLSSLGIAAAGLAVDPERLLWMPGAKKIFVPKPQPVFTVSEYTDYIALSTLLLEASRELGTRAGLEADRITKREFDEIYFKLTGTPKLRKRSTGANH